jgi:hypothetical protein
VSTTGLAAVTPVWSRYIVAGLTGPSRRVICSTLTHERGAVGSVALENSILGIDRDPVSSEELIRIVLQGVREMEPAGIEPATSCLQRARDPDLLWVGYRFRP